MLVLYQVTIKITSKKFSIFFLKKRWPPGNLDINRRTFWDPVSRRGRKHISVVVPAFWDPVSRRGRKHIPVVVPASRDQAFNLRTLGRASRVLSLSRSTKFYSHYYCLSCWRDHSLQKTIEVFTFLLIYYWFFLFTSGCVILIQWFLWVFSQTIKLSSSFEMVCSCNLVSFWVYEKL